MRKRRLMAMLLICSLLAGQSVCAAEDGSEEVQAETSVQAEEYAETAENLVEEPVAESAEDLSVQTEKEGFDWDSQYLYSEMQVYMDIPKIRQSSSMSYNLSMESYGVAVENPEICDVESASVYEGRMYTRFTGKSEGSTRVAIYEIGADGSIGTCLDAYAVTVSAKPADAADITDPAMNYELTENSYADSNDDGYISQDELSWVGWFSASQGDNPALRITDWSALSQMDLYAVQLTDYDLENLAFLATVPDPEEMDVIWLTDCTVDDYKDLAAFTNLGELYVNGNGLTDLGLLAFVNASALHTLEAIDNDIRDLAPLTDFQSLSVVRLSGNTQLADVEVLKDLEELSYVALDETAVSEADRWALADVPETIAIEKGEIGYVPPVGEVLEQDAYQVTLTDGADVVSLRDNSVSRNYELRGLRTGTATLQVTYKNYTKTVTVDVAPAEAQEYSESLRPGQTAGYNIGYDLDSYTLEVEDPAVCSAKKEADNVSIVITGIGGGATDVLLKDGDGDTVFIFHVTVEDWPEATVYIGQPTPLGGTTLYSGDADSYVAATDDETVCRVEKTVKQDTWGYLEVGISVEGLQEGTAMVYLKEGDRIETGYKVTVKNLPEGAVVFEDPALQEALLHTGADKNSDGYISQEEVLAIEYLGLNGYPVTDLTGLEAATNLRDLNLEDCGMTDLSLIKTELPGVANLYLSGNQIQDLSGIENLPNLQYLDLGSNGLSSLEVLTTADLPGIKTLYLDENEIRSLSALEAADVQKEGLSKVTELVLSYNPLSDLDGLDVFTSLRVLNLEGCGLETLEIAEGEMENLLSLVLSYNPLSDLKGIEKFPNLETLSVESGDLKSLESLADLQHPEKLQTLIVRENQLISLEGAGILTGLETLWAEHNEITDVSALSDMKNLESVYLSYNKIDSMKGLGGQEKLRWIGLDNNSLTSLAGMGELPALKVFHLYNNQLTDIQGIEMAPVLEELNLSYNQLAAVGEIGQLQNLETLDLSENLLTNADGLETVKTLTDLNLADNRLTDIQALAGLTSLTRLQLDRNVDLTDLSPIKELDLYLSAYGIGAGDEERLDAAGLEDLALMAGEFIDYPEGSNGLLTDLTLEAAEGTQGVVEIEKSYSGYHIRGVSSGTVTLTASLGEASREIKVTVTAMEDLPDAGEDYEGAGTSAGARDTILDSNKDLWQLYPEVKKLSGDVKQYVSGWIYHCEGGDDYAYIVKNDNTVWTADGQTKLAENVSRAENRYALKEDGTLVNLLNSGDEQIADVKDWYIDYRNVMILKEDGTIWMREENPMGKAPGTLTQIASGAKELAGETGYLREDGTLVSYSGRVLAQGVASVEGTIGYYDADGYFCRKAGGTYARLGQFTVKDYLEIYDQGISYTFYLTDDNKVYRSIGAAGLKLMAEHADCLGNGYNAGWVYQTADGLWYDCSGNPVEAEEEVLSYTTDEDRRPFSVVREGKTTILKRSGVPILQDVVTVWSDVYTTYCLRTDGTVWNVTDVPVQVMDLAEPPAPQYIRGDVDGDGKPGIEDLRLVLRHVCGKITLEGTAYQAADVTDDDDVGIDDLRKILRYVCGKIADL